jgi:magnesium transporter
VVIYVPTMEVLTQFDTPVVERLVAADEFFWLDLNDPSHEELGRLAVLVGLHPAALEDSLEWDQLPKVDVYGDHLLLVFFSAETLDRATEPREVHVYLSGSWIVTLRRCATRLDELHEPLRAADPRTEDEDLIVYKVLDTLADAWDPVVDELDRRVDELEVQVLERPRQGHPQTIYWLKQEVGNLLRHASHQAGVMPEAVEAMHSLPGFTHGSREWLRDVTTHYESIASDLHRISADLSNLTDTFFNANANRLNRLVTYVTIGSVFFLLWTLVTGFFGQNFGYLVRHIDSRSAFVRYELLSLVIPTLILVGVLAWRRRDWL